MADFIARFDMPWPDDNVQMRLRAKNIEIAKKSALNYANLIARDLCQDPSANIKITLKET